MTTGRHLVHARLQDEFTEALSARANRLTVGDPATGDVDLGPIIDGFQLARIDDLVSRSASAGAVIAAGGTHQGPFYAPTVLAQVAADMPAWTEEVFGPVAPVLPFFTTEQAIELAKDTRYGLSLGILGDVGQAMAIADAVPCGHVHINDQTVNGEAHAPFGGVRDSGTGSRFGGATADLDAYTDLQWLTVRPDLPDYPFH